MAMEFFRESGRGFSPKASIRRQGQIGLSQGTILRHKMKDGQFVLLGYDKDEKCVGIKVVEANAEGAKRLTIRSGSGTISAKGFLDYFGIPYDSTRSYELMRKGELLVFRLDEEAAHKGDSK